MSSFFMYGNGSTHGAFLQQAINACSKASRDADAAFASLTEVRAIMVQMLDGDGSQDAHYATIQARFGFADVVAAHAAFREIDSAWGNSINNDSRAAVKAAMAQLFSRLTV